MQTPAAGTREYSEPPGNGPAGDRSAGGLAMTAADADVRVRAARDRLAEIPADDVLVTLDARSLAAVAGKAVMAAELFDAHIRDADRGGSVPVALTLDEAQAATVLAALEDASALRREVTAWCPD